MENIYIILVVTLFVLAISDLIVGVSNDAVNFLNSAIGSKVASYKVVILIAALGVLFGAVFSGGMMEVARKGIFHPEHFYFSEIMIIFIVVMLTDVILLDLFNTFGLPTSTTVSIVFELLGAAVAISVIKILNDPNALSISEYINTAKALAIISGILLSVIVAFTAGAIVQYISRIIFSFNYTKKLKYFGAIWGAIAITSIMYFILIKGAKNATFMTPDIKEIIKHNTLFILGVSFIGWLIVLQLMHTLFKTNILKMIVLIGTFALAMAFAGNDLVNFIGVPLAGLESYNSFINSGAENPELYSMASLAGKVKTPTMYLVLAGLIMVLTLYLSKKARTVIKTTIDLSSQDETQERFGSTMFSRSLVRFSIKTTKFVHFILPKSTIKKLEDKFDPTPFEKEKELKGKDAPAFDLIRASVNLVVAGVLISFATSLKLPLSTTYVTFMVAMGTSLADRAWGRESAVYRITGVLSVIGGWFFTAFSAFTAAFVLAFIIYYGGFYALSVLIIIAAFLILRTHIFHKKNHTNKNDIVIENIKNLKLDNVKDWCSENLIKTLDDILDIYANSITAAINEDRRTLKHYNNKVKVLNQNTIYYKNNVHNVIKKLKEENFEASHYYVQVIDYLRETAYCLNYITPTACNHIENGHKGFVDIQAKELTEIKDKISNYINLLINMIKNNDYSMIDEFLRQNEALFNQINQNRKNQLKRLKKKETGTKISMLYLSIMHESKNLLLHSKNILKAQKDFK